MRLFSEEVKVTSSNSPLNILQVKDFQEVFFGVFEVQINEKKYVAEKISEENGNPIVSILVEEGNEKFISIRKANQLKSLNQILRMKKMKI
jgi:hypothetical protein